MKQVVAGGVGFDLVGTVQNLKRAPMIDGQAMFGCSPDALAANGARGLIGSCGRGPQKGSGNRG
jgi:hypothetical protein